MNIRAKTISNDDGFTPEYTGLYGARFYCDRDPCNKDNRVIKIYTVNTTHNLSSTTNIEGNAVCNNPTSFVFEMKYYFEKIWNYSQKYFRIEFCNNANARCFAICFNVAEDESNLSAERLSLSLVGEGDNEKIDLLANRWYTIRFEYYKGIESLTESRLKIFVSEDGSEPKLKRDVQISGRAETPSRALIVHNATKIRGIQYLDDLSFTLCDTSYTPERRPCQLSLNQRKIYDFEDGIPSEKDFYIDMRLKKYDDFLSMDPATWNGADKQNQLHRIKDVYEVLLVQTGEAKFVTETEQTPIYEGSIVIIPPKVKHDVISNLKYNIISISGNFEQLARFTEPTVLHDNIYGEGRKLAELTLYNRFNSEEYFTSLCNSYLNFILLNINSPTSDMNTIVYKMMDQMKKNYDNSELSIIKLLKESGYAKDYVRTKFFELAKMTPKKYLTSIRMKRAKELLNLYGDEVSVARIAEQCGIVDPAVFSKSFKQFYGVSPKQYLKRKK